MRRFGAAALGVGLVLALVGAGPAAAVEKTVLCKAKEAPCNQVYEGGTEIIAKSANAEFEVTMGENPSFVTCQNSEVESKTLMKEGNLQLEGLVTFLNFENCKLPGGTPCTVFGVKELPYTFLLSHLAGQNGSLTVFNEGTPPGTEIVCGGVDCLYRVNEEDAEVPEYPVAHLNVIGGNPAKIEALKVDLVGVGACAPKHVYFYATYTVSKPAGALWVSYVE